MSVVNNCRMTGVNNMYIQIVGFAFIEMLPVFMGLMAAIFIAVLKICFSIAE